MDYGEKCFKNNGVCLKNLINVCLYAPRDFMALQETEKDTNLALKAAAHSKYDVVYHNTLSIFYDSSKWERKGITVTGTIDAGREYLGCIFFNKTTLCTCALINLHGPHHFFHRTPIVQKVLDANANLCISHVFLMGDFNNERESMQDVSVSKFTLKAANDQKTGWNVHGMKGKDAYKYCVDNVLGTGTLVHCETWHNSKDLLPKEYHTSSNPHFHYANYTSDHSPVATLWKL